MRRSMVVVAIALVVATVVFAQSKPALKIAFNTWVGYGPLYIAQDKGFFDQLGIEVRMTRIEDTASKGATLKAKRLDGVGTTADSQVIAASQGIPGIICLAMDESAGADGVIAVNTVASVKDLKGRSVAVQQGFVGHFFLLYLLDEAGLSPKDIVVQDMETDQAGAAFVAKKVDAAVTWEPWLSKTKERADAHVVITSKDKPGLIVDVLAMRDDVIKNRPEDVKKLIQGWYMGVDYWKKNQADGNAIIAKNFGLETGAVAEMLSGVNLFDARGNLDYFGTAAAPGQIYKVVAKANEVWQKAGLMKVSVDTKKIVDGSLVNQIGAK
ncbi:MAG: ABC transporter substrate-binding protein [Acidobacteriota bacterium]